MDISKGWLQDLGQELSCSEDQAYTALRAVLHVLRDRLPAEESAHLAAQLPLIIRGSYYDGWRPGRQPEKYHSEAEFIERVQQAGQMDNFQVALLACQAVMRILDKHVSRGELEDVLAVLPLEIGAMLQSSEILV